MECLLLSAPSYPFLIYAGDALYRPGDFHRQRSNTNIFDMLFVEYGCLYMMEDGINYDVKRNEVLILHPHRTHRAYKACDEKTHFHWLHFDTVEQFAYADTFRNELSHGRNFIGKHIQPETLALPVHQRMSEEYASHAFQMLVALETLTIDRYQQSAMKNKLDGVVLDRLSQQALFLNLLSGLTIRDHNNSNNNSNRIAYLVMQYLQINYRQKITLSDMAAVANCHPTHVIRCFKQEYDSTPAKTLTNIRVDNAKVLLKSTNLSCEAIAEQTGFSSTNYFSKMFKETTGSSPLRYRQSEGV